ncbi:MAG TPA: hypothetical protein VMU04_26180 [Candidatus Acidoferrum sp.]|nr:hypothetical protein [Candidatus Acidoferrum sp.]
MKNQLVIKHGAVLAVATVALLTGPPPAAAGNWNVNNVPALIGAINAANRAGGVNTITLAPGMTFTLTAVNNTTDGPNGLPVIMAKNKLTIRGNGAAIARSTAPGTPAFRLFNVAAGASLTLTQLSLVNGLVVGDPGTEADGGAVLIEASGSLTANYTMFTANQVVGGDGGGSLGGLGHGGAIENEGTANLDRDTFTGNQAIGGATTNPEGIGHGGQAFGGAVGNGILGTLTATNCRFSRNQAIGGLRHSPSVENDGIGVGGAVANWNTAVVTDSTFSDNDAVGGAADPGVDGEGGMGGAVASNSRHTSSTVMTIEHCTFSRNLAISTDAGAYTGTPNFGGTSAGGAIATGYTWDYSTMTITDCTFAANQAIGGNGPLGGWGQGGAILAESPPPGFASSNPSTVTIARSTFTGNQAVGRGAGGAGQGGAIFNIDWNEDGGTGATLTISDSTFSGNAALGAAGGDGDLNGAPAFAQSGAVDTSGNTTIRGSTFLNNRAIGGSLAPGATPNWNTASIGGGLSSWAGTLYVAASSFVGNQAIGAAGETGVPGSAALGGGIEVDSGLPATILNCLICNNSVVGGAGGSGAPGGTGLGGGLDVELVPYGAAIGPSSTVAINGTMITHNQAIGGAGGGEGKGGGYAVGTGVLFGIPDTSSVTLNGGSVVSHNRPDNAFHF